MINPLFGPPGACDPRVIKYNVHHLKFLNLQLKNRRSKFVSIESASTYFCRDNYSEAACPVGDCHSLLRDLFSMGLLRTSSSPQSTVMALVASP